MARYLTKSKFKEALDCQTKLYYLDRPKEYHNTNSDNEFLQALAGGGYQVGELAKFVYPGGVEVTETDHAKAVAETQKLMAQDKVTIYEGAFLYNNFFIRADVIRKNGSIVELLEVKSKSVDPGEGINDFASFSGSGGVKIKADYRSYMYDIAFQTMVCRLAYPDFMFKPFLVGVDKTTTANVDGLHQLFKIMNDGKRKHVIRHPSLEVAKIGDKILGKNLLAEIDVSVIVDAVLASTEGSLAKIDGWQQGYTFEGFATEIANKYVLGDKIESDPGTKCKKCQFRCNESDGMKSGFNECWSRRLGPDLGRPMVYDIWKLNNAHHDHSGKYIRNGQYLIRQLKVSDLAPPAKSSAAKFGGWTAFERKEIQVEKELNRDNTPAVLKEQLAAMMAEWKFPLHFIDFETSTVALPFNKGRRPYETIAFQFSHHIMDDSGKVSHAGQYIHAVPGEFPNFAFVRKLKEALSRDNGTIFRYSNHENYVLRAIRHQLSYSSEPDRDELMAWIDTITNWEEKRLRIAGPRNMVDLAEVVREFYYHPLTNGSNSLKAVLPAIIAESKYLQAKYSRPVYGGSAGEIPSLNFKAEPMIWFQRDPVTGLTKDPYKLLRPVLPSLIPAGDLEDDDADEDEGAINNGGLAMMAYCAMQFTDMDPRMRTETCAQLLQYCELDTLAMVMLYEHFRELVGDVA